MTMLPPAASCSAVRICVSSAFACSGEGGVAWAHRHATQTRWR